LAAAVAAALEAAIPAPVADRAPIRKGRTAMDRVWNWILTGWIAAVVLLTPHRPQALSPAMAALGSAVTILIGLLAGLEMPDWSRRLGVAVSTAVTVSIFVQASIGIAWVVLLVSAITLVIGSWYIWIVSAEVQHEQW